MVYAQILSSVVRNVIVLNDTLLIPLFSAGFDFFIRIDLLDPEPAVGWTYDGTNFSPPATSTEIAQFLQLANSTPYLNNDTAKLGGLVAGQLYRNGLDPDGVFIVH